MAENTHFEVQQAVFPFPILPHAVQLQERDPKWSKATWHSTCVLGTSGLPFSKVGGSFLSLPTITCTNSVMFLQKQLSERHTTFFANCTEAVIYSVPVKVDDVSKYTYNIFAMKLQSRQIQQCSESGISQSSCGLRHSLPLICGQQLPVSSHGLSFVCACVLISSS